MVKVACLANMNNMMFVLCRYLRDAGFDAHLITLIDEPAHFTPASDSYTDEYLNYCTVLPYTKSTIYSNEAIAKLKTSLDGFDFYIGTDIAPALLALVGKKLDVFIPHGSDLYSFPFETKQPPKTNNIWWLREKQTLRKFQLIGIEHTSVILFPDEYNTRFPFKDKLKTEAKYYNTSGPMVYSPQYKNITENQAVKALPNYTLFSKLRAENDLLLFSHSRHNGFDSDPSVVLYQKGNDILINGFDKFIKKHPDLNCKLIFFEYGRDVEASKTLIEALGIKDFVEWMPLTTRNEIMFGLNISDISCGHFKTSWLTCGVVNETLASDKPLLHNRKDELYAEEYQSLYPILNAKTADDVTNRLSEYIENREKYNKEAEAGSVWLVEHTVKIPLEIIKNTIESKPPNDTDLPLSVISNGLKILKNYRRKYRILSIPAKLSKYFR